MSEFICTHSLIAASYHNAEPAKTDASDIRPYLNNARDEELALSALNPDKPLL